MRWFQKAENPTVATPGEQVKAEAQQGSFTDFSRSAYALRQSLDPLHGEELMAFNWVMDQMEREHPDLSRSEQIEQAFVEGWFEHGVRGELRVSREMPT